MLNKVTLMGRLTRDPELRYGTNNGASVTHYSLAVERKYQKDKNNKETDFINIVAFGKAAEFAAQYFKKGQQVAIVGRLQTGSYNDKDGKKIYTTDVIVEEQFFAGSKSDGQGQNYQQSNSQADFSDGDIGFSLSQEDEKSLPF